MAKVGIRELRNSLSAWVRRAERGERIAVTDRGRVVAVLSPPPAPGGGGRIAELIASGEMRPALTSGPFFGDWKGLGLPPGTAQRLIDEDRGE